MEIEKYRGCSLSKFKTFNSSDSFIRIRSESDIEQAFEVSKKRKQKLFVLGGGSNVFFKNTKIKSLILKNELPQKIEEIGEDLFEVSSSTEMMQLLNYAFKSSRNCCYYLASAPCQVGGAIAMNAGSGPKQAMYISDFIDSVKFFDGEKITTKNKNEIFFGHRKSEFLKNDCFIISTILRLPKIEMKDNPIVERLLWAKENQDLTEANCGSLCNKYNASILRFVQILSKILPAGISQKKLNWAINKAQNPLWLRSIFALIRILHKLFGKELKFEIRIVN